MTNLKYFVQFIFVLILFLIFKLINLKSSRILSGKIFSLIGPLFRSNKVSFSNLDNAFSNLNLLEKKKIMKQVWANYGKIFAEYMFIKNFSDENFLKENILLENYDELLKIKNNSESVIFISGHFNNFELMAMMIQKSGINLSAVYRPLNNIFLNPFMENIRKKYICRNQIKKGISGTKELLKDFKKGNSIALMIDQRVSEGIKCKFFNKDAYTTTIPAQFVKRFNAKIIPVYIERKENNKFKMIFSRPLLFNNEESIENITSQLNVILEKMILKNPEQWIWTHNRWK